ncbi:MAG: TRAP transporter small permease [Desulfobacterales bacterium]
MYKALRRLVHGVEVGITVWSWSVTLGLTLLIVADIFLRYFFSRPLPATWEIGELCMPHVVFLPFAFALTRGSHVRVAMLTRRISAENQRRLRIATNLLSAALGGVLTLYSWRYFSFSFSIREDMLAAVRLMWWWGKIAMPVGMAIFTLRYLLDTVDLWRAEGAFKDS